MQGANARCKCNSNGKMENAKCYLHKMQMHHAKRPMQHVTCNMQHATSEDPVARPDAGNQFVISHKINYFCVRINSTCTIGIDNWQLAADILASCQSHTGVCPSPPFSCVGIATGNASSLSFGFDIGIGIDIGIDIGIVIRFGIDFGIDFVVGDAPSPNTTR